MDTARGLTFEHLQGTQMNAKIIDFDPYLIIGSLILGALSFSIFYLISSTKIC